MNTAIDRGFVERHQKELAKLRDYYHRELTQRLVPFWQRRIVDTECGGYFACFDTSGNLLKDVKPGWFVGRNIYTFANLYNETEKRQEWIDIAQKGVDWILRHAHLGDYRFASMMDRSGRVVDASRSIFNDAFCVKGYYEFLAAKGNAASEEQIRFAQEASDAMYAHSEDSGLLAEEGVPLGFVSHAVNFMMLLCAMESRQVFGDRYREVLTKRLERAMYRFADDRHHAVFEYLDPDYNPRLVGVGRLMDPGHALESCWFSLKAAALIGSPEYMRRAETVIDWILEKGWDHECGGVLSMCDIEGGAPEEDVRGENYCGTYVDWDDKVWWAQAEGLNALAMSAVMNGNEAHFSRFMQLHDYVNRYFRDPENGEWYAILDRENQIMRADKGMENKGPYHVVRSAVLLYRLFRDAIEKNA